MLVTAEALEARVTPSAGYTVAQIRDAYGVNAIPNFGTAKPDGTGQTIAIVVPGNDPTIVTDLDDFDQQMTLSESSNQTLYSLYGTDSGFFSIYNQAGQNITGSSGTSGSNGVPGTGDVIDITIGIEWSHAIAPGAKIDLVESTDYTIASKNASVVTADNLPGVSVVVDDLGDDEYSAETSEDSKLFVTPAGHVGETFLGCAGDVGEPTGVPSTKVQYPQASPYVIGVGGTQLTIDANDSYGGETAWSFPTPSALPDYGTTTSTFNETGSWTQTTGGYGTYSTTAAAGTTATATWTMASGVGGTGWNSGVEVSTTWLPNAANATNATYSIYDGQGTNGTLLGIIPVDQTKAPIGITAGNSLFQELGVYFPTSGYLTVQLNAKGATGKVVADAIGLAAAWAGSGGPSQFEAEPAYQEGVQQSGAREVPDVAWDASQVTPVAGVEAGNDGYFWGTTPSAPSWAGLFAIADQGRVAAGLPTLDSPADPEEALNALYSLPSTDYHQITAGYTGYEAGPGYDMATGLGSPIANALVPDLVAFQETGDLTVTTQPPASVTAGHTFGLTVTLESPGGSVDGDFNGAVTLSLLGGQAGARLYGTVTTNAVNGVATFTGLSVDVANTNDVIEATATGEDSGTSAQFAVVAGPAAMLGAVAPPPTAVTAGEAFGAVIAVEDAYGNIVGTDKGNITLALTTGSAGSVLGGTLTQAETQGFVNYDDLSLNKVSTADTLTVSHAGLPSLTLPAIAVIAGPPARLVIVQEPPATVKAGALFGLTVAVEDSQGNVLVGDDSTKLSAIIGIGNGTLLGTTSVEDNAGITTFTTLADDLVGMISITLGSLGLTATATSSTTITPAAPTKLVIQAQPSANASAGIPFAIQPLIDEEDQYGNLETTDSTTAITVTQATGSGPLIGSTKVVVVAGVAKFGGLGDSRVETTTLKFAGGSLTTATSNAINVAKPAAILSWTPSKATGIDHQAITLTATVAPPSGLATPTGSVTFLDGSTVLGSAPIVNGRATLTTSALRLGTQSISLTYAGDSTYAAGTSPATPIYVGDLAKLDFDGDGKADIAIFDPVTATFAIQYSGGGSRAQQLGNPGDVNIPVFGDYDGDGKTDVGLYDQTAATFLVLESGGGSINIQLGNPHDVNVPVVGDFTGSGKTNLAIFDKTTATFYVLESGKVVTQQLGNPKDVNIPVAGDYDGDGKTDFAVFDQTQATFLMLYSGGGSRVQQLGNPHDVNIPIAGDFDGDGKTDIAVYDQTQATFLILESGGGTIVQQLGIPGDANVPVAGDFDGDGKTDIAVYDQTAATFLILDSGGGSEVEVYGNPKHKNIPG